MLSIEQCKAISKELKEKFSLLKFDEPTHTYTLKGKKLPSVSKLIGNFHEHFDSDCGSASYAKARGILKEQVLSAWDGNSKDSIVVGHKVHLFGEIYAGKKYYSKGELPLPTSLQELAIVTWWHDMVDKNDYLYPVGLELMMHSEKYGYAGTADILLIDRRDGKLIIADYKTCKDIFKKAYSKMYHGFEHFPSDSFHHYTLQFSFYQIMLEEMGYTVKERVLVWLKEDEKKRKLYQNHRTENVTHILRNYFENNIA